MDKWGEGFPRRLGAQAKNRSLIEKFSTKKSEVWEVDIYYANAARVYRLSEFGKQRATSLLLGKLGNPNTLSFLEILKC